MFQLKAHGDSDGSSAHEDSPAEVLHPAGNRTADEPYSDDPTVPVRYTGQADTMATSKTRTNSRIFILLAILLAVLSVALIVFIVIRELTIVQELQDRCGSEVEYLQIKFPGYFRTQEQQEEYIRALEEQARSRLPETSEASGLCRFQCFPGENTEGGQPLRKRRDTPARWIYHSCCQSYKNRSSIPTFRNNLSGTRRELVQTANFKQYFTEETCRQVPGCGGCSCSQPEPNVIQAVVFKDKNAALDSDKYETDYLQFDGCCKCLNIKEQK